ncbi:MAG: RNA polymerase sigma factor [Acidimicrobiales bacterium]
MSLPPFQSVLDEHRQPLWRFLVAAVGPHDAADCFQETMIAALRAYPSLRHADNLRGWLFTIAHRKVIDSVRANGRRPLPVGELPERADTAAATAAAGSPWPPTEPDDELWASVRALPVKQRSAVVLRHLDGWSYAEIGELLDCSEPAARQNVKAGLDKLRQEVVA